MGNSPSSNKPSNNDSKKDFENFYEIIDYIATYYILTMDFKSLTKLSEKEYCDNLVILTSDIVERYFNDIEITYLGQRIKDGLEVNELKKENVNFLTKQQLDSLDIQQDEQKTIKKKRVCIGIAKFYIKIAHVFAAIVMTINPVYMYKDAFGNVVKTGLLNKDKIPKNVPRKVYKMNICDERIHSLMEKKEKSFTDKNVNESQSQNQNQSQSQNQNQSQSQSQSQSQNIAYLNPKLCTMNVKKDGSLKNLADEPGIMELMQLYLDDNYDYSNGTFTGMTEETKKQFQKNLKTFYTAFTGNENMPPEITKFSDIKLRDYHARNGCKGAQPVFQKKITVDKTSELFIQYANNLNNMIDSATKKQKELLSIINELFSFVIEPYSGKKKIRVNPKLTEANLQKIVEASRTIIMELYVKCETDYVNGMKIYEAIVESKILETTKNQIQTLQKESEKTIQNINSSSSNLF